MFNTKIFKISAADKISKYFLNLHIFLHFYIYYCIPIHSSLNVLHVINKRANKIDRKLYSERYRKISLSL